MATQSPLSLRVMATHFRSHAYRRQRNRNSIQAAVSLIHDQAAALQAVQFSAAQNHAVAQSWNFMSSEADVCIQAEVANRLVLIAPAIRAQVHAAAFYGQEHHSARLLIGAADNIMGNAAKHQFDAAINDINPQLARKKQRKTKKEATGDFAAPCVGDTGVFAAPVCDATGIGVFAAPVYEDMLLECQSCNVWAFCDRGQVCGWCHTTRFANAEVDLSSAVFDLDEEDLWVLLVLHGLGQSS